MSILLHLQISYMSKILEASCTLISEGKRILGTHPMKTMLNELDVISPTIFFRTWFHTTVMGSYNY